ncbi:MAG: Fic family protein [Myxococcus sp.]|nr:Fic family protein [Myxococcus sp.]
MDKLAQRLLEVLEMSGSGLTRAELEATGRFDSFNSQQLLRALRSLAADGLVRFEGNTRARTYWLQKQATPPTAGAELALSPEAAEALGQVGQPLHARAPVSYQRRLLDGYAPRETSYLPKTLRERLRGLGKTKDMNQPAGTYARHVLERFLLDLSWNSARLEGNTYSLLDTEKLLKAGASAEGKSALETQMLLNHKAAIEFVVAEPMTAAVDERTIKTLHALLLENLLGNRLDEGRLRATPVQISGSVYLPLANPQLIDECFRQLVLTARAIEDPFECAFFLLVQLPYLQPFIDGNKRTARLAANLPLVIHNLVPLSFVDVPRETFQRAYLSLYELNRVEPLRDVFSWAYERSAARLGQVRASLGEPDPFRLEHRQALREAVGDLVRARVPASKRRAFLTRLSQRMPAAVRARFVAMAELEVEGLNESTFARYGLRPSEFDAWAAAQPG